MRSVFVLFVALWAGISGTAAREIVAFSAKWIRIAPSASPRAGTVEGRFYRSADGSTLYETLDSGKRVRNATLRSVATRTMYAWTRQRGWQVAGWPVEPVYEGGSSWVPGESIARRWIPVHEEIENFALVRNQSRDRAAEYSLHAPALNFFPLRSVACPDDGTPCEETRFFDIRVGPPPRALFEVPPTDDPR